LTLDRLIPSTSPTCFLSVLFFATFVLLVNFRAGRSWPLRLLQLQPLLEQRLLRIPAQAEREVVLAIGRSWCCKDTVWCPIRTEVMVPTLLNQRFGPCPGPAASRATAGFALARILLRHREELSIECVQFFRLFHKSGRYRARRASTERTTIIVSPQQARSSATPGAAPWCAWPAQTAPSRIHPHYQD
jgi:hypothetical protein